MATAPPQQIIIDPNATGIMHALSSRHNENPLQAEHNISHVSMGGVKALGAAIAVRKNSITMEPIENDQFIISFEYTSTEPATVSFLFHQLHEGLEDGVPLFSKPLIELEPINLPVGAKLKYKIDPDLMKMYPPLTIRSCSFQQERSFVPILILLKALHSRYEVYIMAGLVHNECKGCWDLIVTKQRFKQGNTGYQIQEIYGLNVSAVGQQPNNDKGENNGGNEDDKRRCVVCLTNRNDTFIMPCRHMCICFVCANAMTSQYTQCPMCRGPISHIIRMSQAEQ